MKNTRIVRVGIIRVGSPSSASNLHIASPNFGLLHVSDYAKKKLCEINKC